jgi:hypothetical protein
MTRKTTAPQTDDREAALAALDAALSSAGPGVTQAVADTKQFMAATPPHALKEPAKRNAVKTPQTAVKPSKKSRTATVAGEPVAVSSKPGMDFAAAIDDLLAKKISSDTATVKAVVVNNYSHILRGYKGGISLVHIAPLLSGSVGIDVKHGTLRAYFLPMAAARGDIPRAARIKAEVH